MTQSINDVELAAAVGRVRQYFESLSAASVAQLNRVYAPDAYFKDPFNEVRGVEQIGRIFRHMFEQVQQPRFVVHHAVMRDGQAFLTWDFIFESARLGRGTQVVRGASHLQFAANGRVTFHRDYWDAAEELYEKLPLVGRLLRWLRRRVAAH